MRSVDKLLDEKKKKGKRPEDNGPDEVEIMMEFPPVSAINQMESVFDRTAFDKKRGINTAPSVFKKGAVFQTGSEEK